MHEISPVLAGTFDSPDYMPARTNFNVASAANDPNSIATTDAATSVSSVTATSDTTASIAADSRRYTKFDHSAADSGEDKTFSFSDFLDMVNPLQHIPVISSVYRSVTDEKINPVSRVAGDIMYGGVFGVASAVMGAVGAAADSMIEAQTGKDAVGFVLASLSGDDTASAKTATQPSATALAAAPAPSATLASATVPAVTTAGPTVASANAITSSSPAQGIALAKSFPINSSKQPFGGAMVAPVSPMDQQNMAMALSDASHASLRLGDTIYTSRLMNGPHPAPTSAPVATANTTTATTAAVTAPAAPAPTVTPVSDQAATVAAASDDTKTGPQKNPIPQNLVDDLVMLKALGQYKSTATGPTSTGATVDITN